MRENIYISAIVENIDEMQIKADYFEVNGMIRMAVYTCVITQEEGKALRKLADKKLCELDRED